MCGWVYLSVNCRGRIITDLRDVSDACAVNVRED